MREATEHICIELTGSMEMTGSSPAQIKIFDYN